METKTCPHCQETKPLDAFELNSDGSVRKHVCKLCYGRKYRAQLKLEMLEAFGGKCQCCEEDHPFFLSLDHVNNDGADHRREYESSNNNLVIADAKRKGWPKDKYQLLCMNCNTAKGYYGECPHKSGLTAQGAIDNLRSKQFSFGKTLQNMNFEGLKLGPQSQKLDPAILRQHRLANSKKQKSKQVLNKLFESMDPELVEKLKSCI